jgi:hypothetical protein
MQANEPSGQVHQGPRLAHAEPALTARRAKPETRAQGLGADASRPRAARPPARKPQRYGAGF